MLWKRGPESRSFDRTPRRPSTSHTRHRPGLRFLPIPILLVAATLSLSLLGAGAAPIPTPGPPSGPPSAAAPEPFIAAASHSPMPSSCSGSNSCAETVAAPAGWKFTVYRNFPMSGSAAVTRAVIVVHGTGRNAAGYFASVAAAAAKSGVTNDTMVIAPWFKTPEDSPGAGEATWTSAAWKIGDGAQSPKGLSSFLVMDQIIATLADRSRFPNLRDVVVTGHSAGGQFTQRYAAFGLAPNVLRDVHVSYVPANPSSYVYFTTARPTSGNGFQAPGNSSCSDYDTYKYGLEGRGGYPAKLSATQVLANYTSRQVTIVNGGADTVQNGDMDDDCGANLQGPNRASRGANFVKYIHSVAPRTTSSQGRIVVNGVDHDGDAIFNDPAVRYALFDSHGSTPGPSTNSDTTNSGSTNRASTSASSSGEDNTSSSASSSTSSAPSSAPSRGVGSSQAAGSAEGNGARSTNTGSDGTREQ